MFELILDDMSCGHCEQTVTHTIRRVDPDAHIQIDLSTHTVRIESRQEADEFRSALAEEGYPAR